MSQAYWGVKAPLTLPQLKGGSSQTVGASRTEQAPAGGAGTPQGSVGGNPRLGQELTFGETWGAWDGQTDEGGSESGAHSSLAG